MELDIGAVQEIPGYKIILKAVLKRQIQHLVEQLSTETDEECLFLTASINDGTLSHLGSNAGKSFLDKNENFKSQFLGFCLTDNFGKETTGSDLSPGRTNQNFMRMKPSLVSLRHPLLPHKSPRKNPYPAYKPPPKTARNGKNADGSVFPDKARTASSISSLSSADKLRHAFVNAEADISDDDDSVNDPGNLAYRKSLKGIQDDSNVSENFGGGIDDENEASPGDDVDADVKAGSSSTANKQSSVAGNDDSVCDGKPVKSRVKSEFNQNVTTSEGRYGEQEHAEHDETLLSIYDNIYKSVTQESPGTSRRAVGSSNSASYLQGGLNDSNLDLDESRDLDIYAAKAKRLSVKSSLVKRKAVGLDTSSDDHGGAGEKEPSAPPVKKKRKRNDLTLADRIEVLKLLDKKLTQTEISKIIGCSISQVCRINGHRDEILAKYYSSTNPDRKRQRTGKANDIELALKTWYEDAVGKGIPVTASALTEKARGIAKDFNFPDFNPSPGWVSRWKTRSNVTQRLSHGSRNWTQNDDEEDKDGE